MDQAVTVALIRGDDRRGAVAQALALLVAEVARCVAPRVLIWPSLAGRGRAGASTHAETLSATLDAVFAADAAEVAVAAAVPPEGPAPFHILGYFREAWGRPVEFLDLRRDEAGWDTREWDGPDGSRRSALVSRTVSSSRCRISLATASSRRPSYEPPSLLGVLGSLHPGGGHVADDDFLIALARRIGPHLSLVDTFEAGRLGGGGRGKSRGVGAVIAGVDAVAVDAVAAAVVGHDPRRVALLSKAQAEGLGVADLDAIRALGDPIRPSPRKGFFRPHGVTPRRLGKPSLAGRSTPDRPGVS